MQDPPAVSARPETSRDRLSVLYLEYSPFIGRLVAKMGMSPADVEDAVHDIFIEIFEDLPSFRGQSNLKTWIYRIAVNHCLNRLRRKRRIAFFPWSLFRGKNEQPRQEEPPDRGVWGLLEELSPKLRGAVVLKDIEGLSYDEIAESLEIAPGTAMSRVARGREELRILFSKSTEEKS